MSAVVQLADDLIVDLRMPVAALQRLATLATRILQALEIEAELTIYAASDVETRQLNARYRGIDAVTDVLSFPAEPLPAEIAAQETPYLGDLILAYQHTIEQAVASGHQPADEFALVMVHGILHLIGYDHDAPETQAVMWHKQAELLAMLGIDMVVPDFVHMDHSDQG